MPRDRDDQYDDEDDGPGIPVSIIVAGLIWALFGVYVMFCFVLKLSVATPDHPGRIASLVGLIFIGAAYVGAGIQVIRGRLIRLAGMAATTFVFSLFFCGVGVLGLKAANQQPGERDLQFFVSLGFGLLATALMLSGLLILIGRGQYRRWRVAEGLEKPARSHRRRDDSEDEDDDDDRPRRLRSRNDDDDDDQPRRRAR